MDAAGDIFKGYSDAGQYATEAALAAQQARDASLQAVQNSEQRREQLNASLANIRANRAEAGLSNDSPTAMAIQGAVTQSANRAEGITRLGYLNEVQSKTWQAAAYKKAGKNAVIGGYINGLVNAGKDAAAAMGM